MKKMTVKKAVEAFLNDSFDLVLADETTIEKAAIVLRNCGHERADDIYARWDDYQEEMRWMARDL